MAFDREMKKFYTDQLEQIREGSLYKQERKIMSPQYADIDVEHPKGIKSEGIVNICSNNYLGMSNHPDVITAARDILTTRGYGMSSVRFICGTQDITLSSKIKCRFFWEWMTLFCTRPLLMLISVFSKLFWTRTARSSLTH
ncbi:MAG TPA: hypothetical protein PKW56_07180 [Clostridiales bacterium]|nr:hypothetical protein [Clostridiales bacterium]